MDLIPQRVFALAAEARLRSQTLLATAQSHAELPWINDVTQIADSGYLQALVLVISVLWTASRLIQRRNKPSSSSQPTTTTNARAASIRWPWELLAQLLRASTLAFLALAATRGQTPWLNAVVAAYALVLGLSRLVNDLEWRHVALHQVNFALGLELLIFAASSALPCIEVSSECALVAVPVKGSLASLAAAVVLSVITPREWVPPSLANDVLMPEDYEKRGPAPEETCSWANYYLTFEWLTPVMWKGARTGEVVLEDLPQLPWYDEPLLLLARIKKARARGVTTTWTLFYLLRKEVNLMAFYISSAYASELVAPYGLYHLLGYLAEPHGASVKPWLWLVLMFCGPLSRSVLFQQYVFTSTRLVVRLRSALTQELYHRAMGSMELEEDIFAPKPDGAGDKSNKDKDKKKNKKDEEAGRSTTSAGRLANLMAADVQAIFGARDVVMAGTGVPVGTILSVIGLYRMLGWPALVGTLILLLAAPVSVTISRLMGRLTRKARRAQDSRISLVSEYLASIRAVKYFAWEDAIIETIEDARANEQRDLWRVSLSFVMLNQISALVPYISMITMFSLYVGVCGQPMTAATAFTTTYLVKQIRRNVGQVAFMSRQITGAAIAISRLDRYFATTTPLDEYPEGPLRVQDATFRRNKTASFQLKDLSIDFAQGGLNVVSGVSGSGKTTLLLAILGETVKEGGTITRPKDVAFASQTSWLQNDTIKENILFNSPLEPVRYDAVVNACCLPVDLRELDAGDQTVVGENGASLSGGQKARVALARALYSKAPLLLLDDIFSALDAKTAASLWERCFCSDLLKGRTVVLPWVAAQADVADGAVKHNIGVVRHTVAVAKDIEGESSTEVSDNSDTETDPLNDTRKAAVDKGTKDVEMKASGKSARLMFFKYMTYFGGPGYAVFCMFLMLLSQLSVMGGTLWLSVWVDAYDRQTAVDIAFYLGIYAAVTVTESVLYAAVFLVFENGAWHAARKLHNDFIRAVMRVSLSWYKKTPVGRIINRFSSDMSSLDLSVSPQLRAFLESSLALVIRIFAISSIMPIFIVPAAVASTCGLVVGEIYTRTAVTIKRLVASSQSPIFSQFADTLAGLPIIRARAGMPDTFGDNLADKLRVWSRAAEAHFNCNRWVAMRVDVITALVGLSAGIIAVSKAGLVGAGLVGFSLHNATGLSQTILGLVRSMNDLEVELQSFVRIKEYAGLDTEEKDDESYPEEGQVEYTDTPTHVIPKSWPATGEIEFRNVTIRYDQDGPNILTDVNLKFRAGERVAIVGRTGSGKSTLVLSLLRFTHIVSGQILYDGIDITKIPRRRLREALTIIPQEAVLFNGTLRTNLDPTGKIAEPKEAFACVS
ncbi:LOW QUALITY PROTEIN: ABC transporter type 1, transmembrane domain-containing protein [Colletotrichum acutatum]|uniref:ABC transporter type 1, transmembrane domain-containing protein n=1 Tax=Glomerella acutata TaxID=27357 RepID=A0AAD8XL95_GLOAC|nr:LOW QUALITY PROTEIN: ABC transporter type 1, transmembrane domain-containing protein [Colletotrichum acutatum]KAK1729478.1 LOW QUALITY PROTEIN: ABC transporter type 1, transmembrane domain-containing protein [Colletotrichum acutatum]